jgi:hypothetical protein
MIAILRCQAKNRFYESTQRLIQPRRVLCYLAFFLPMAATRVVLIKTGAIPDIGTMSAVVTAAALGGALAWYWAARNTPFRFLFARPAWARLSPSRSRAMQPAE